MAMGTLAVGTMGAHGQAVVDDLEGGNSINKFGGQWSFSGDFWDKGDSKILSAVDTSVAVPFFKGAYGGGYPDGSGNAAKLEFRFGTTRPGTPPNTYDNNVSMNCPLGADDALLNLTGGQAISFWAKADQAMQVEAILATANITDYAYYTAMINVTTSWTKFTIKLATGAGGLTRRAFGTNKPLDLTQAQSLGWEVNKGKNPSLAGGTLWIDDIVIEGYTFVAPEPRGSCLANGCIVPAGNAPKPSALLADFEGADPTLSALGLPWAFGTTSGTGDGKFSSVNEGVDLANFVLAPQGHGYNGGNGGLLGFELGDVWFTPEGYLQLPAAYLNTTVSDTSLSVPGATGVYFDYKTTGEVDYVDFKVKTTQIHADNIYAVPFTKLKATGGEWKGAWVKWSDFVLPNWGPAFKDAEKLMRFTDLVNLEWSVTSAKKNIKGSMAVDNVYITGISELPQPVPTGLKALAAHAGKVDARIARGALELPFTAPAGLHHGVVRLLDASGHEWARGAFAAEGTANARLRVPAPASLPRGLMVARIESRYGKGSAFTASIPVVNLE
jgi:hypothetical protein